MSASADRNLLFGILALQMDFVTRDQLIAAMNSWVLDKARPLGEVLRDQNVLSPERVGLLSALMAEHLKQHGNDPAQSLAMVSSLGSARKQLMQIADADVQASLGVVAAIHPGKDDDPNATRPQPTVGAPTSGGLRFRILRPHAEGGLGKVSVAEDGELRREVALKEIKDRYADHPDSRARFVLEAEVTGGLEHPGIVPVYGLGTYADGRPFYAMRFIKGDSLKEAVERFHKGPDGKPRKLNRADFEGGEFRGLLGRFVDVCQAIAYAHSRKVLHRDLKPGNIMLGKYGETLVVDWGLAKPLYQSGKDAATLAPTEDRPLQPASASGTEETIPGMAVGTPEYMSPEQAEGRWDIIGPASDIYSLGATLFAVLTGHSPVAGLDIGEMLRRVQRGEIASARQVSPTVPPALEAVCRKAQALRPTDRYGSALDLAADVEHWLADEPVTAWREPVSVRAWRWVRRHRTPVTGLGALVLAAAVGLGLLAAEREKAREAVVNEQAETAKERDVAREQKRRTRAALDTMISKDMIERLGAQSELTKGQHEFFQIALNYYQEFAAEAASGEEARKLEAFANFRVGFLLEALGRKADAASAYATAVSNYEKLASDFPQEPDYRCQFAESNVGLGAIMHFLSRGKEAEPAYRAAVAAYSTLVDDFPNVADYRGRLAKSRCSLGFLLSNMSRLAEAQSLYRIALAAQEKLAAEFPGVAEYRRDLADTHYCLGLLAKGAGPREAEYRSALAIQQKLAVDFANVPTYRRNLARTSIDLGNLLSGQGKFSEAELALRAALRLRGELAAEFPAVPDYRRELAIAHNCVGSLLARQAKLSEAETAYRAALSLDTKLVADIPDVPGYRSSLATNHQALGKLLAGMQNLQAAEAEYRAAVALRKRLAADFPSSPAYGRDLASCHHSLGAMLVGAGQLRAAEVEYRAALAARERVATDFQNAKNDRHELAVAHNFLGNLLFRQGKPSEAEAEFREAVTLEEKLAADNPSVPDYRRELAMNHSNLGILLLDSGKLPASLAEHRAALAFREKLAADSPKVASYRSDLAYSYDCVGLAVAGLGQRAEADAAYRAAIEIQEKLVADAPKEASYAIELCGYYNHIGKLLRDNGEAPAAVLWHSKSVDRAAAILASQSQPAATRQTLRNGHIGRAKDLMQSKRFAEALPDWDMALKFDDGSARLDLRAGRADCLARLGRAADATREAGELAADPKTTAARLYGFACVFSLAAATPDNADAARHADRAVALLHQAIAKGYTDIPTLLADADLAPLRRRADYADLLWDLADMPAAAK